jgi:hypothetical protein
MAAAIDAKVEKLDEIDIKTLRVHDSVVMMIFLYAHHWYLLAD